MNNIDIISVILTAGTGCLGVAVSLVQYIIGRKNEEKETEIKYRIKYANSISHETPGSEATDDHMEIFGVKEDYLHRLLESYHNQALQQANIQFWFSIIASVLGFVFIFMIITQQEDRTWYEYILKSFPGVIVEVISALFISQARETRERATNLFRELNYDSKIEKSVDIADTIDNCDVRSEVKAKIALHIIGMNDSDHRAAEEDQEASS